MKTGDIARAYELLNASKVTKMEDADKFKVIKAMRILKPIAVDFNEHMRDAREKLKGEDYEVKKKQAIEFNQSQSQDPATANELNEYFANYLDSVNQCVSEVANKEIELSFDKLSEAAFTSFIGSNDFDIKTITLLQEVLM